MGTLTINGKSITVDNSFANLSPADQEKTVNEISQQMGPAQAPPPNQSPVNAGPPPPRPDLMSSIGATVQGITGSIPGLNQASDAILAGGQSLGQMAQGQPTDFGANYNAIQQQRNRVAQQAPIAQTLGGLGGTVALTGAIGAVPAGAEALGLAGSFGKQLLNSTLSMAGYEGLQGLAHGHTGNQLLADEGIGGASGLGGSLIGQGLNKAGEGISSWLTNRAQSQLTKKAIENAPAASDLFSAGSQMLDAATGGTPLQVTDNAYMKLLSDVQNATQKYRPNENTSKEGVGILQKLWKIGDELNAPNAATAVDFKDLHILRQTAQQVTMDNAASKESKTIAGLVVNKIDDFVNGLKPADIAGSTDPKAAANALMQGISTWHKASKVSLVESAIQNAQYNQASGIENALRIQFRRLISTPQGRAAFTEPELQALQTVANGTTVSNTMKLLGKFGFSPNNMLGGLGGVLTGNAVAGPLGAAAVGAGGYLARQASEALTKQAADRAAQVVATSAIPVARQVPNYLAGLAVPVSIGARALLAGSR